MNKETWGLHQRAEGATRQGNSAATPITQKAKGSPLKLNEALISGELTAAKQFHDVGAGYKNIPTSPANDESKEPDTEDLGEGTDDGADAGAGGETATEE